MDSKPSLQPEHVVLRVANDRAQISAAESRLLEALERFAYAKPSRFAVRLALEEALTNAFRHGHRGLPRDTPATLELTVGPDQVTICVEDQGSGFKPRIDSHVHFDQIIQAGGLSPHGQTA